MLELMSRARTSDARITAMVRAATNPGGISGPARCATSSSTATPTPRNTPSTILAEWSYIPAIWTDNPYLDPKYVKRLKASPRSG